MLDSDASSAKSLVFAAIIIQLVFFLIGILGVFGFAALFGLATNVTATGSTPGTTISTVPSLGFGLFFMLFSGFFLIGLVWILLDYFLVYKRLESGNVREAETPVLVLGILQLLFGGIISGILLIIAYTKIGDSIRRNPRNQQNTFP